MKMSLADAWCRVGMAIIDQFIGHFVSWIDVYKIMLLKNFSGTFRQQILAQNIVLEVLLPAEDQLLLALLVQSLQGAERLDARS
jgi:hypothetical protein